MSQEPKVTRFGANPTVPQELATKAYVDAGGGGGASLVLWTQGVNRITESIEILIGVMGARKTGTEADANIPIQFAITIIRHQIAITANAKTADVDVSFRDDGVSVATLTIPSATSGKFDSGVISVSVASGSLINWRFGMTTGGNFLIDSHFATSETV